MLYGKDWKKMQPLIKTRSLVQIRTHAQKVFKKIGLKKIAGVMKRRGIPGKDGEVEVTYSFIFLLITITIQFFHNIYIFIIL